MAVFVLVILVIYIVVNLWKIIINVYNYNTSEKQNSEENIRLIYENEQLLLDNYRFYKLMPEVSRRRFVTRLQRFIEGRTFIGRDIEVDFGMKMIISAAAIKLSFGLEDFELSGFKKILVYPQEYYSRITRQYHKGEANGMGVLAFSWKHFKEGIESHNDNLNLGVHEFAHAYFLQQTKMQGENPFDDDAFKNLEHHIEHSKALESVQNKELFRDYAFRNEMEFFAIMAEHFFETPSDFKRETPQLYHLMSKVLQQDPTKLGL